MDETETLRACQFPPIDRRSRSCNTACYFKGAQHMGNRATALVGLLDTLRILHAFGQADRIVSLRLATECLIICQFDACSMS